MVCAFVCAKLCVLCIFMGQIVCRHKNMHFLFVLHFFSTRFKQIQCQEVYLASMKEYLFLILMYECVFQIY